MWKHAGLAHVVCLAACCVVIFGSIAAGQEGAAAGQEIAADRVLASRTAGTTAVLPFANITANPQGTVPGRFDRSGLDWLGEAVAATVREALGARGLLVLEREETVSALRNLDLPERAPLTRASVLQLQNALGVDQVVYGTFSVAVPESPGGCSAQANGPETIPQSIPCVTTGGAFFPVPYQSPLTLQARVARPRQMQASTMIEERGMLEELATLEAHLAWETLQKIAPEVTPSESQYYSLRPQVQLDSEELYARGLMATGADEKERLFRQSLDRDGGFWRAAFELGKTYIRAGHWREAAEVLPQVDPSDMHYPEARFLLGIAQIEAEDYEAAEATLERVALSTLGRRAASSDLAAAAWNNLGVAQNRQGAASALASFERALEIDPDNLDSLFNLGYALWKGRQYEAAADRLRAVLAGTQRLSEDSRGGFPAPRIGCQSLLSEAPVPVGICLRELTETTALLLARAEDQKGLSATTSPASDERLRLLDRLRLVERSGSPAATRR